MVNILDAFAPVTKKYGNKFCSSVHMREDELIRLVTESLKSNISKYLKMEELDYNKTKRKKSPFLMAQLDFNDFPDLNGGWPWERGNY